MTKIFASALLFALATFSGIVAADEKSDYSIEEAEQEIMRACIENEDNSREQCVCVLGSLKSELPEKDYRIMMNIITMAMNGDLGGMWDYAFDNDFTLRDLKEFGETLDSVGKILDKKCGEPDVNLDLNI